MRAFSMTFPGFSMTIQAWNLVFLNPMTFHDFPGPVVTLYLQLRTISGWYLVG